MPEKTRCRRGAAATPAVSVMIRSAVSTTIGPFAFPIRRLFAAIGARPSIIEDGPRPMSAAGIGPAVYPWPMTDPIAVLDLLDDAMLSRFRRQGHFVYESGRHGELWLALELLVVDQ